MWENVHKGCGSVVLTAVIYALPVHVGGKMDTDMNKSSVFFLWHTGSKWESSGWNCSKPLLKHSSVKFCGRAAHKKSLPVSSLLEASLHTNANFQKLFFFLLCLVGQCPFTLSALILEYSNNNAAKKIQTLHPRLHKYFLNACNPKMFQWEVPVIENTGSVTTAELGAFTKHHGFGFIQILKTMQMW